MEQYLLAFTGKFSKIILFFQDLSDETFKKISSKEELRYQIENLDKDIISEDERIIMLSSLQFNDRLVRDIMINRNKIEYVESKDVLGPLVLDRLHSTTFGTFPVIKGDIDHIVGIVSVKGLLNTDTKKSPAIDDVMSTKVHYIRSDHSLEYALAAFTRTRQHFFIVINDSRETEGILTLRDVMESLLGRRIKNDFDDCHEASVVTGRRPNNSPRGKVDV